MDNDTGNQNQQNQSLLPSTNLRMRRFKTLIGIRGISVGGSLFVFLVLVSIFAPLLAPNAPNLMNFSEMLKPPSFSHILGTDNFGRNILSREIYGLRLSIFLGFLVAVSTGLLGMVFGLLAGYSRLFDSIIMRVSDGLMAFPWMVLAVASMAFLGSNARNVVIVLSIVYLPRMIRIIRSSTLVERDKEYVVAAQTYGVSTARIIFRHILPNILAPLIVQLTFTFAYAVLNEALLDFLGIGVQAGIPSLGKMISESEQFMYGAPWMAIFPGLGLAFIVVALNLLGDGIQDALGKRNTING